FGTLGPSPSTSQERREANRCTLPRPPRRSSAAPAASGPRAAACTSGATTPLRRRRGTAATSSSASRSSGSVSLLPCLGTNEEGPPGITGLEGGVDDEAYDPSPLAACSARGDHPGRGAHAGRGLTWTDRRDQRESVHQLVWVQPGLD